MLAGGGTIGKGHPGLVRRKVVETRSGRTKRRRVLGLFRHLSWHERDLLLQLWIQSSVGRDMRASVFFIPIVGHLENASLLALSKSNAKDVYPDLCKRPQ